MLAVFFKNQKNLEIRGSLETLILPYNKLAADGENYFLHHCKWISCASKVAKLYTI